MVRRRDDELPGAERWARFRLEVIGPLLASPAERGDLSGRIRELASRTYRHPLTDQPVSFGYSTIERWYYDARGRGTDPIVALKRRTRRDAGRLRSIGPEIAVEIEAQYREHPSWTYQLHFDNLCALLSERNDVASCPSYSTLRRFMKGRGLVRRRRRATESVAGFEAREVRSFERAHPNSLWHLDFHHGSRKIARPSGHWETPILLAILDDHSRLVCHAQWFLDETAESLVHGLVQAFLKRGLPRDLLTDNGAAMIAAETTTGLLDLGILHHTTLPYSPYQNGKQEVLFSQVEGRLLALLEHVEELDLATLNRATIAWVEQEYNKKLHRELRSTPIDRFLDGEDVGRPSPAIETLRSAFTMHATRRPRRSDGTLTVDGIRFEIPERYRHLPQLTLRYARWNLAQIDLVDPVTGARMARLFPLDKERNADGRRRRIAPSGEPATETTKEPALLRRILDQAESTGLPPAYIPQPNDDDTEENE